MDQGTSSQAGRRAKPTTKLVKELLPAMIRPSQCNTLALAADDLEFTRMLFRCSLRSLLHVMHCFSASALHCSTEDQQAKSVQSPR